MSKFIKASVEKVSKNAERTVKKEYNISNEQIIAFDSLCFNINLIKISPP